MKHRFFKNAGKTGKTGKNAENTGLESGKTVAIMAKLLAKMGKSKTTVLPSRFNIATNIATLQPNEFSMFANIASFAKKKYLWL